MHDEVEGCVDCAVSGRVKYVKLYKIAVSCMKNNVSFDPNNFDKKLRLLLKMLMS